MKYLSDEDEESSNVAIFRPNFDEIKSYLAPLAPRHRGIS